MEARQPPPEQREDGGQPAPAIRRAASAIDGRLPAAVLAALAARDDLDPENPPSPEDGSAAVPSPEGQQAP
ncbi:hypothetical protein AB0K18_03430 [Nonomuraea sp. NPDC049421]|uniref:hypothetical protein n=1 Tax=Nonomuraea sp. NPDC049421 TaxID=3155275 RepID=UPI00343ED70F